MSHIANTPKKDMNPTVFPSGMGKTDGLFNFGMVISLGENSSEFKTVKLC